MAEWSESQDRYFHDWKRVRSAIEHENNLVNHRLTWLFLAQGGLFTAFFSSSGEATGFIRICVAVFGMFICGFIFVPLREADKALVGLNDWWRSKLTDRPEECKLHPPIQRRRTDLPWYFDLFQPQNICFVFMAMWIVILIGLTGYGGYVIKFLNTEIRFGVILAILVGIGILIFMFRYPKELRQKPSNSTRSPG